MTRAASAIWISLLVALGRSGSDGVAVGQSDVIKVKTELLQLRAVVSDRKGRSVEGLSKDDFVVAEDGTPVKIEFFSEARVPRTPQTGARTGGPDWERSGYPRASAATTATARSQRAILLLVDRVHNSPEGLESTRAVLKHFVTEQLGDLDQVAIVANNEAAKFDRDSLLPEIDKIPTVPMVEQRLHPNPLLTPSNAARIVRREPETFSLGSYVHPNEAASLLQQVALRRGMVLSAIRASVESLAKMPGQRILTVFSEGFSMVGEQGESAVATLHPVISSAARAGVLIYCFDMKGLRPALIPPSTGRISSAIDPRRSVDAVGQTLDEHKRDLQSCLSMMATETGGEAFFDTNRWSEWASKMLEDNRDYYELAYYPSDKGDPNRRRKIEVTVRNHSDFKVRSQRSYVLAALRATPIPGRAVMPEDLYKALREGAVRTDIGMTTSFNMLSRSNDAENVEFQIRIRGEDIRQLEQDKGFYAEVEILVMINDPSGKEVRSFRDRIRGTLNAAQSTAAKNKGFIYTKRTQLSGGKYEMRVGIVDAVGQKSGMSVSTLTVPQ